MKGVDGRVDRRGHGDHPSSLLYQHHFHILSAAFQCSQEGTRISSMNSAYGRESNSTVQGDMAGSQGEKAEPAPFLRATP